MKLETFLKKYKYYILAAVLVYFFLYKDKSRENAKLPEKKKA